jgi:hypothetical protein
MGSSDKILRPLPVTGQAAALSGDAVMIHLFCPNCQSRLSAKDELLGQTRNCPQCGEPVLIALRAVGGSGIRTDPPPPAGHAECPTQWADVPSTPSDQPATEEPVYDLSQSALPQSDVLKRLDRHHHYLICDRSKLVAAWKDDGQGWLLKTNAGLVSAVRNSEQLPNQGDFKLVELRLHRTDAGLRLAGIRSYQLAQRWALTSLDKGDDKIVSKITGLGCLNRDQKNVVRQVIKDHFMREVWADAENVLEYLADTDYHSPGTD